MLCSGEVAATSQTEKKMNSKRIDYRWDTTDPQNKGWYFEVLEATPEGYWVVMDDSMKVGCLVDTEDFDADSEVELVEAIKDAYPDAAICRCGE